MTTFSTFLLSTFIVGFIVFALRPVATKVGLVDRPCSRKQHVGDIPLIGGVSIYIVIAMLSMEMAPFGQYYNIFMLSSSFMVFIGMLDDYYDLSAKLRLVAQIIIGAMMVYGADLTISNLGHLIGGASVDLGPVSSVFTILCVVACINAFNMTDGMDGLVSILSLSTLIGIAAISISSGLAMEIHFIMLLSGAIFGFMFFNLGIFKGGKFKVFMGDAGSMLMGLSIIWLLAYQTQGETQTMRPITAVWLVAIPLMDMMSVMIRRIQKGDSPMKASRDHLHHLLGNLLNSPLKTLCTIALLTISTSAVATASELLGYSESIMLIGFIALFIFYHFSICKLEKLPKKNA